MEYLIAIIFIVAVASLYFQSRLKAYEQVVYSLNQTVKQLQKAMAELQAKVAASDASPKAPETVDAPAQTASAEVAATEPEAVIEAVDEAPAEPGPVRSVSVPDAVASFREEVASRPAFEAVETDLSSRWMIWVGGLALALGGAFLVKVSIDAGLLAPGVRVVLACLFGLGLGVAGEAVRRKRGDLSWLEGAPDYLPAALSAAGIFTLFAAIFSAYGLYDLIPPLIAFIGLAIVTLAASALALLQGRFFAYLGLVGGMVVPALVSTGGGSAWALFPYLLFIAAVTLAIARNRVWADVAVSALALALVWVPVWIVINWHTGDGLPVGLYILLLGGASLSLLSGATPARSENASLKAARPLHPVSLASDIVILIAMLLLCATVRLEHYATPSLVLFGLSLAGLAYAMLRNAEHDVAALGGVLASLFLIATWHLQEIVDLGTMMIATDGNSFAIAPIAPPEFAPFVSVATLLAVGIGLYAALPHLLRKPLWASISAAYPLVILVIAYGRLNDFETSVPFAALAVLTAGLTTGAVARLRKMPDLDVPSLIAAYAAGASMALALALSMVLRDAWLSFGLAVEIAALAHIWRLTGVNALRPLASLFSVIVLYRLLLNEDLGGTDPMPVLNWLFYGYGLTAVLFAYAARVFGVIKEGEKLPALLKGGATLIAVYFITFETRVLLSNNNSIAGDVTALEAAIQTVNWGAASAILFWQEIRTGEPVFRWIRRLMTVVSILGLLLLGGTVNNIFLGRVDVGLWPILNLQLLQFLVPGLLYGFTAWMAIRNDRPRSALRYGIFAFTGTFVWVSAEVRHLFHPTGGSADASVWELYSYSLAWLMMAVALLAAGIRFEVRHIRMAGLALLGFVVLKVFLFDMANLEGVARALSFIGLGGALIGIGYLYQYFQRQDRREAKAEA